MLYFAEKKMLLLVIIPGNIGYGCSEKDLKMISQTWNSFSGNFISVERIFEEIYLNSMLSSINHRFFLNSIEGATAWRTTVLNPIKILLWIYTWYIFIVIRNLDGWKCDIWDSFYPRFVYSSLLRASTDNKFPCEVYL